MILLAELICIGLSVNAVWFPFARKGKGVAKGEVYAEGLGAGVWGLGKLGSGK